MDDEKVDHLFAALQETERALLASLRRREDLTTDMSQPGESEQRVHAMSAAHAGEAAQVRMLMRKYLAIESAMMT